jgi:hypothetical protein
MVEPQMFLMEHFIYFKKHFKWFNQKNEARCVFKKNNVSLYQLRWQWHLIKAILLPVVEIGLLGTMSTWAKRMGAVLCWSGSWWISGNMVKHGKTC